MKISVAAFVFFGLIGIVAVVGAQQSGAPRTILQRLDMSVPDVRRSPPLPISLREFLPVGSGIPAKWWDTSYAGP
jgi:hypothetical protein